MANMHILKEDTGKGYVYSGMCKVRVGVDILRNVSVLLKGSSRIAAACLNVEPFTLEILQE